MRSCDSLVVTYIPGHCESGRGHISQQQVAKLSTVLCRSRPAIGSIFLSAPFGGLPRPGPACCAKRRHPTERSPSKISCDCCPAALSFRHHLDPAGPASGPAPSPQSQRTLRRKPNPRIPVGATHPAIALQEASPIAGFDPTTNCRGPPPPSSSPDFPAATTTTSSAAYNTLRKLAIVPDARRAQMSPGLKPLLLPRLVEERRKQEQVDHDGPGDQSVLYYPYDSSSSSSDLASPSPIASTFSRTNHSRLSSSSSSLELTSPPYPDSPASPTQSLHATRPSKSQLPDVQEEPLEREEEEPATPPKRADRDYGFQDYCLCESCPLGQTCSLLR